jgi:signal transduction histidine kinase
LLYQPAMSHQPQALPPTGTTTEVLARAFERFESAADSLGKRHAELLPVAERLEQQLATAHRRLEAVLDAVVGGVALVTADGTAIHTNHDFGAMGLGRAGSPLPDEGLRALAANHGRAVARWTSDSCAGRREFAATRVPVDDVDGACVLTVQDVTELRRDEERDARRLRLEALGRMAAELAHEVRNPLGSIRLFASMLRDDLRGRPDLEEMAVQILAATAGLESTVSNLLAFASPSRAERRLVDLSALAADVCALLSPSCQVRGVGLEGPAPGRPSLVVAEPEGMRQVVLNLLSNALAATEAGGRIAVSVARAADTVSLRVEDTGRGIAAEDLARVFDPFFSRTEGGSGLGLSIVHAIVERQGGRIRLESRPGTGTVARVDLPATDRTARAETPHA